MIRSFTLRAALGILGASLVFAAPLAAAPDEASSPTEPTSSVGSWVRVSLDAEDPFVSTATREDTALLKFHIFAKGRKAMRGIDYGLAIEGGTFLSYAVATDRVWLPLPIADGYPGSIGQAIVGDNCEADPILLGTLLVEPDEKGGRVSVVPVQSEWSQMAYMLDCENRPMYSYVGYGACVNGRPGPPAVVRGDEQATKQVQEGFPEAPEAPEDEAAPSDGASID